MLDFTRKDIFSPKFPVGSSVPKNHKLLNEFEGTQALKMYVRKVFREKRKPKEEKSLTPFLF